MELVRGANGVASTHTVVSLLVPRMCAGCSSWCFAVWVRSCVHGTGPGASTGIASYLPWVMRCMRAQREAGPLVMLRQRLQAHINMTTERRAIGHVMLAKWDVSRMSVQ